MGTAETPGIIPGHARWSVALQKGKRLPRRHAGQQSSEAVVRGDDRRRFQRVNVPLLGRFMRPNRDEHPCQIVNVSPGGIAVRAPVTPEADERIVLYVDNLGRIEGRVVRAYHEGFALELSASAYKREKIANQLTWLVNKDSLSNIDDRRHDRIVPRKTSAKLFTADGTAHECVVLDVSLGGAAVCVEPKPAVGQLVTIGLTVGRVVRHSDAAVSIQFLKIQDPATLERQFG